MAKIRVLIVDDSSIMRNLLTKLLSAEPDIEVVGTAPDPYIAREKLVKLKPDVMTLDIEMPRMNGIEFLEKVMEHFPTRTIMISSLSKRGSEIAMKAFELGAVDVLEKPTVIDPAHLNSMGEDIIARVRAAAEAKIKKIDATEVRFRASRTHLDLERLKILVQDQVLAIAASTGGVEALVTLFSHMPSVIPAILVVQHMPAIFTKALASRLQKLCPFEVKEAEAGDEVRAGRVLIAPGNYHMEVLGRNGVYVVKLHQQPPLHNVRPSADYLFQSVAKCVGSNAVGVVLTGMGKDGSQGLAAMKETGSFNLAQNEATCVVFGMPKAAISAGAIHRVVGIEDIAQEVMEYYLAK